MKRLLYILNVLMTIFVFVSCKDEESVMPNDNEPCYTILVSTPDAPGTRATYTEKESGSKVVVEWEKGDAVVLQNEKGRYVFVFKKMDGNNGVFYHYGPIPDSTSWTGTVTFGSPIEDLKNQTQEKNNKCGEYLVGSASNIKLLYNTKPVVELKQGNINKKKMSLIHIQTPKSPGCFLGSSLLEIKGLDQNYIIKLGENPNYVFADEGDTLNIYVSVPEQTIGSGKTLKFYFYSYDNYAGTEVLDKARHGDEYHYYMKSKDEVKIKNNEVLKMTLPSRPTRAAIQLGLPSGTKWATTNVGASTATEEGLYFWWGDVNGHVGGSYDFGAGESKKYYELSGQKLLDEGVIGDDHNLVSEKDAAIKYWGIEWKMPNVFEISELKRNCTLTWTTIGNVSGCKVENKNGKWIFLPADGYYEGTASPNKGTEVNYLGSSLSKQGSYRASNFQYSNTNSSSNNDCKRYEGLPIRPVLANYKVTKDIEGTLFGEFSVSATSTVRFSKGNLRYQASTNIWRFAEQQYDVVGYEGNMAISKDNDKWIDLFGWGTSGWNRGKDTEAYQPYSTSTTNADYWINGSSSQSLTGAYKNADWGEYNPISNGGNKAGIWRTLTSGEWNYLYNRANGIKFKATVNGNAGIVLFPDLLIKPDDIVFDTNTEKDKLPRNRYKVNVYTAEEWKVLEFWGALFLPSVGFRKEGNLVKQFGSPNDDDWKFVGCYWSSTASGTENAKNVRFGTDNNGVGFNGAYLRHTGHAVRLVREVK